jgi:polysaccharide export outer membrane protein
MRTAFPALWFALWLVAGCTPRYSMNPATFQGTRSPNPKALLTLGPGDIFDVRVYNEPDISGSYRITGQGFIRFPLVGLLKVEGLTPTQIEELLRKRLEDGYLRDPQVMVFVKEFNSKKVFVFGEVNRPGTFVFEPQMNIIQAITLAGGFTRTAWKNRTNVTRLIQGEEKKIQVPVEAIGEGREKNFDLRPGDIIFVPESPL